MIAAIIGGIIVLAVSTTTIPALATNGSDEFQLPPLSDAATQVLEPGASPKIEDMVKAKQVELRALIQQRRATLKEGLKKVKDAKKRAAVDRVDQNLQALNDRMTTHWAKSLDQMTATLSRVREYRDGWAAQGKTVDLVCLAITRAQQKIDASRTAAMKQAAKTYPIKASDKIADLRKNVKQQRTALRNDLNIVRNTVREAHGSVRVAAQELHVRLHTAVTVPNIDFKDLTKEFKTIDKDVNRI